MHLGEVCCAVRSGRILQEVFLSPHKKSPLWVRNPREKPWKKWLTSLVNVIRLMFIWLAWTSEFGYVERDGNQGSIYRNDLSLC
jgi:hypothetical protein